jgi:uncharacterized repeat protein (TIGR03803 family)
VSTMRNPGISMLLAAFWLYASGSQSAAQTDAITDVGTTFTSLFSFDDTNGEAPRAALVQATDGNFYGTTVEGGAMGDGTVFKITPSGAVTTLHSFDGTDGFSPEGALVQATNGNFYGTTAFGGANGKGTVFEITPSGTLTTLASFNGTDGQSPEAALIQATDGNFYGTTSRGGANKLCPPRRTLTCGTVFEITPSGTLTTLASFGEEGGSVPFSPLIQATDGNFYGTTPSTVFKVTPSGTLTTLAFVSSSYAGLVQATDGNFYGTTEYGGNAACDGGCGTVFKVTPSGTLTTLLSFTNSANPVAALIQATDGNLYGTTGVGGTNNDCGGSAPGPIGCGMVFKVTLSGTLSTLFSFDSSDGAGPQAALLQATNGEFYGTTAVGGASEACNSQGDVGCGTVFSLSLGLGPFVETQPGSGAVGVAVNILGASLTGATSVTFNGRAAIFKVISSSEITTTVPTGATTGEVEVVTPSGTLSSNMPFQVP